MSGTAENNSSKYVNALPHSSGLTFAASSKTEPWFTNLNDLMSEKVGGKVIFATDDRYGVAENILQASEPEWKEGVFTEHGKWVDGWSTARNEDPDGRHWCVVELGVPGLIRGIDVDTLYFSGNFAEKVSIQAARLNKSFPARGGHVGGSKSDEDDWSIAAFESENWASLVPRSDLKPGYPTSSHNYFEVDWEEMWTHIRLNLFPDGGIARLRVYGQAKKDWTKAQNDELVNLVAMENGGICVSYSSACSGHARNVIAPGDATAMEEGWVTSSTGLPSGDSCGPVSEWAVFKLGHPGVIDKVEVDTSYFKGNFPDSYKIDGCLITNRKDEKTLLHDPSQMSWRAVLPVKKLSADNLHVYLNLPQQEVISHVRLAVVPNGGISRLRLWGYPQTSAELKAKL
ncbi:probable inactive allantoicase [Lineus longissimus]|uniref:probable inactive allantoicase n=1 Tax=Lineus longissimus TaxID=88925 RepID=UPI002B4DA436